MFILSAFYQKKIKKNREKYFSQRRQVSLPDFSSHYMLNAKEGICEYSARVYSA